MKSLETILEGVMARGKWFSDGGHLRYAGTIRSGENTYPTDRSIAYFGCLDEPGKKNAAFAARAAANFEPLVKALEAFLAPRTPEQTRRAYEQAEAVLVEALKD